MADVPDCLVVGDLRVQGDAAVAGQGLGNALVGVLAFKGVEILPGAVERRRMARSGLRR